jgi:hypothetical protein
VDKKSAFLIIAFAIALISIVLLNSYLVTGYYDQTAVFGPLSRYPIWFLLELAIPIGFFLVILQTRKLSSWYLLIPIILYITVIYVGLQLSDNYYITNFFDGVTHITRGVYVASTGTSNALVDPYFDIQPAFFWVTAIISSVCGFQLVSLTASAAVTLVEWAPIIALIGYLPILYFLYKQLLGNNRLIATAILIHLSLEITTFHYAAQTYARLVYWLLLATIICIQKKPDRKLIVIAFITSFSLFFIHEGLTILLLLALTALAFYPALFRISKKSGVFIRKEYIFFPITLVIAWLIYLSYYSMYQLGNLWRSISLAFESLISEGTGIISTGTLRADIVWSQIVLIKSIYILGLVGTGFVLSYYNGFKRNNETDKLSSGILLFAIILFGGAAIGLGGAGYLERLPSMLMPLIVYSLIRFFSLNKNAIHKIGSSSLTRRRLSVLITSVSLIIIVFTGSIIYVAGTNFHSVTFGEYYSNSFLAKESPKNIVGLYSNLAVLSFSDLIISKVSNETLKNADIISIERRQVLETYFYIYSNASFINKTINDLSSQYSLVYNNPDTTVYVSKAWEIG